MRIVSLATEPIWTLDYRMAGPGGQSVMAQLPILTGKVDRLPVGLEALVCTSDLQGVVDARLLGEVLAEELSLLAELGAIPVTGAVGVLLAGDLYAAPGADERGATGDVSPVWKTFADSFRWVAGVAGNHDRFEGSVGGTLLDGELCTRDTLRIAGIGGVIGNPAKLLRRSEAQFVATIGKLARSKPDLLILHESPAVAERSFLGSAAIRIAMEAAAIPLTVCGHAHWAEPMVELSNGCQVLNVDSRVVVLTTEVPSGVVSEHGK